MDSRGLASLNGCPLTECFWLRWHNRRGRERNLRRLGVTGVAGQPEPQGALRNSVLRQFNRGMRKTARPVVWEGGGAQSPSLYPIRGPAPILRAMLFCCPAPFALRRVDFVLAFAMVHEMAFAAAFFREAAQALKPGARLPLTEPAGHVKPALFEAEPAATAQAGLNVADLPAIRRSLAALLRKP